MLFGVVEELIVALECIRMVVGHSFSIMRGFGIYVFSLCLCAFCVCLCLLACVVCVCCVWWVSYGSYDGCDR